MIAWLVALSALAGDPCARSESELAAVTEKLKNAYDDNAEDADSSIDVATAAERDAPRIKLVRKLDKKGRLCTPQDKYYGAYLLTRSNDADDAERAYELALVAMENHVHGAKWLTGLAYDRFRVSQGVPQSYGTQTRPHNGRYCLITVDPEVTDEDRAAYDLPPLEQVARQILDANGHHGLPATLDELRRRDLYCDPVAW